MAILAILEDVREVRESYTAYSIHVIRGQTKAEAHGYKPAGLPDETILREPCVSFFFTIFIRLILLR